MNTARNTDILAYTIEVDTISLENSFGQLAFGSNCLVHCRAGSLRKARPARHSHYFSEYQLLNTLPLTTVALIANSRQLIHAYQFTAHSALLLPIDYFTTSLLFKLSQVELSPLSPSSNCRQVEDELQPYVFCLTSLTSVEHLVRQHLALELMGAQKKSTVLVRTYLCLPRYAKTCAKNGSGSLIGNLGKKQEKCLHPVNLPSFLSPFSFRPVFLHSLAPFPRRA